MEYELSHGRQGLCHRLPLDRVAEGLLAALAQPTSIAKEDEAHE
jgi:hypothetical protein